MKKIITLLSLMLCMFVTAQEKATGEYMYIFHSDNRIERVEVAKIDSVTFVDPYQAVDLGLPSGVKWASFNVGARAPWEYGGYYAWGETEEKENYDWSTYKWCNGSEETLTKYCTDSGIGTVDNKTVLDPEDDVATVQWGGDWRMPTTDEQQELINNCTWQWTALNSVNGYKVTGPNGNSIFLPAAGWRFRTGSYSKGDYGSYWSSTLNEESYTQAYALQFYNTSYYLESCFRRCANSVRPVCGAPVAPVVNYTVSVLNNENGTVLIDGENIASTSVANGTEVTVTTTANDGYEFAGWFIGDNTTAISTDATYTFTVSEDVALFAKFEKVVAYEAVDLGLPSGIKWAAHNVGATKPEECGSYYAWGETEEKEDCSWETYKWCNGSSNTITKYCTNDGYGTVDNKVALDLEDDVAHVKWGGDWRMPTIEEQRELIDNCTGLWTTLNGVNGYRVTGPNGNSIFLPVTGYRIGACDYYTGTSYYSSSSLGSNDNPYYLSFVGSLFALTNNSRSYGMSVRPVCK